MFDPAALIRKLQHLLDRHFVPNVGTRNGIWSLTLPMPEIRFPGLPHLPPDWFYWAQPDSEHYLLGFQLVHEPLSEESDPLTVDMAYRRNARRWVHADPENTGLEPLAFLAFAFDRHSHRPAPESAWHGLPAASLFYPTILLRSREGQHSLTFSYKHGTEPRTQVIARWLNGARTLFDGLAGEAPRSGRRTDLRRVMEKPDSKDWLKLASEAKQAIQRGELEKIVLARMIRVQAERPLQPARLMAVLDCLYPSSRLVAINLGGRVLAAASPERLVSLESGRLRCDAMAGTIHRAAAEEEDRELANRLLNDPKTRREHAIVVQTLADTLHPLCDSLQVPGRPKVIRLRNLQHLFSELRGNLTEGCGVLGAALRLHPTPAVSGAPRSAASQWLARREPISRGWYSGGAGWIDPKGNGEVEVLLRCALLDGTTAELYAGAGVLAESEEQAELEETELKFAAMLEALENA